MMSINPIVAAVFLLSTLAAQAACPSTPTASRFTATGAEVTDQKTGLVWARCSVGQTWSGGACTGTATLHTHEQALQIAQTTSGWRMPNVKELASIADKGCESPVIDVAAFPNTPSTEYWTSSPRVRNTDYVWSVNFELGVVGGEYRDNSIAVRLVRISP